MKIPVKQQQKLKQDLIQVKDEKIPVKLTNPAGGAVATEVTAKVTAKVTAMDG